MRQNNYEEINKIVIEEYRHELAELEACNDVKAFAVGRFGNLWLARLEDRDISDPNIILLEAKSELASEYYRGSFGNGLLGGSPVEKANRFFEGEMLGYHNRAQEIEDAPWVKRGKLCIKKGLLRRYHENHLPIGFRKSGEVEKDLKALLKEGRCLKQVDSGGPYEMVWEVDPSDYYFLD